jgi:hypothetical protein
VGAGETDPRDADTDDDGVLDGAEPSPFADSDGDGLVDALDVDSDDDGLLDGTELGVTTTSSATDVARGFFVPDADTSSTTDPRRADTDRGSVIDGVEDPMAMAASTPARPTRTWVPTTCPPPTPTATAWPTWWRLAWAPTRATPTATTTACSTAPSRTTRWTAMVMA